MIINIASFGGRSHLLDTARELQRCGHDVRFYSYITDNRAEQFGLKRECNVSLLWFAWPYLIWQKLFGFGGLGTVFYQLLCDLLLSVIMRPCDVFIGQSPMHYRSIIKAKEKWGAVTILERGNSHVLEYLRHLEGTPEERPSDCFAVRQDIKAYPLPDYISVGAEHVKDSFLMHGIAEERIFVNNYGFNTSFFHPTVCSGEYDLIFVGAWSYRKGCDILAQACARNSYRCLHVGAVVDGTIDEGGADITHVGIKPEQELVDYYSKARCFVLPSREEGLALVQLQAAVCGLPIVCSAYSGGRDLLRYAENMEYVIEMPEINADVLCNALEQALVLAERQVGERNYMGTGLLHISFEAYGRRYHDFLNNILSTKGKFASP